MNLFTTNLGPRSRRIPRVTNKEIYVGYNNFDYPGLYFSVTGQDGVKYTITLYEEDLNKLVEARQKYAEHFPS